MRLLNFQRGLLVALSWLVLGPLALAGELSVHFIDVGQGDATLIVGPDGTTVLIDGGSAGDGSGDVVPYLTGLGLTGLDYSIMTHWHSDHMGGLDEVFDAGFKPSVSALDRGNADMPSNTQVTQYLASVVGKRNFAFLGQTIALGDGAVLEVVAVNGQTPGGTVTVDGKNQEENGRSVAVWVRYKDFDLYVGGDVTGGGNGTANVETNVANYIGQVEIAKASHHGSNTSSQSSVVATFDPALVIYSCGLDNPFGHPASQVVDRYGTAAAARMQWGTTQGDTGNGSRGWTSADGTIEVRTNGYVYSARPSGTSDLVELATFENPFPPLAPGGGVVTEVLVDPLTSNDAVGEWVELGNLAGMRSLAGAKLRRGASEVTLHSPILLGSYDRAVVGADGHRSRNGDVFVPLCWPEGALGLPNFGGTLELLEAGTGGVTDGVTWPTDFPFLLFPGFSAERTTFDPASSWALSTGTFGSGDRGTPNAKNSAETYVYPTVLTVAQAFFDDAVELRLEAPGAPFQLYAVAASPSITTGFDVLGLSMALDSHPLVTSTSMLPGSIGALDFDRKTVKWALPGNPAMIGQTAYVQFATFDVTLTGTGVSTVDQIVIQ